MKEKLILGVGCAVIGVLLMGALLLYRMSEKENAVTRVIRHGLISVD